MAASSAAAALAPATTTAAATVATATSATVTAAAAAVAAATTTAAAATTGGTSFAWASLIDRQRSAFHGLAVELRDGSLSVRFSAHRDKGKAAGLAGEFILHERDFGDRAGL